MRPLLLCILTLFLITACSVGPNYKPPNVKIPSHYKEAPSGRKFADPQDICDRGKWWQVFNDPLLNELEERVNISNQNIKVAIAQYDQATALLVQTRSAFYPMVSGSGSVTREKQAVTTTAISALSSSGSTSVNASKGAFTDYNVSLNASWIPDIWGSVRRAVEANVAGVQASAAQVAATRLLMQSSLAQYYFELRGLDGDQKVFNDTVKNYQRLLEITLNQYRAGTVSRANVLQVKSLLELAQVQAIDNGILRAQYEHAIAVLVGLPPANMTILPEVYIAKVPSIPVEMPSMLLERRPDIAQAERLVAEASAEIGVAIAAYFPVLTLTGANGYNSTSLSRLFTEPAHFWSLGAQLADTLFDGGLRRGKVDQACAVLKQTVAQYRQTVLTAFQNVEDNLVALRVLDTEIAKQNEAVKTSREALSVVLNEYKAGTLALSDVLNAEITLYTAQKGANDIAYRQMTAAVNLITALGGGWDVAKLPEKI
ncbi:MAG: efflux transporter outer membrane subunit [Candidatus Berkiellales bacterium]